MPRMTGGHALAKQLYREGVRVIFGLPGVQLYHLLDGLHNETGIRFITTRHEQSTTYMADGYSRAGGEGIGTALIVPGPGLQNASAGIGTAFAASSPILVISGQIQKEMIGKDRGMLHEVNDQLDTIRPVIKWGQRILNAKDAPEAVHEAFFQLKSGRPRPVEIEIPPETLAEQDDIELIEPVAYERPAADADSIKRAVEILGKASNPLIYAGGGVNLGMAGEALRKIAEHLQAPVIMTGEGKGAIDDRHYLSMGSLRLRRDPYAEKLPDHDVVFAVGTRFAFPEYFTNNQTVVQLDIDPVEVGRNYKNTVPVVGDARRTLEEMLKVMTVQVPARVSREQELAADKAMRMSGTENMEPLRSFVAAVRSALPDDSILVAGMTQTGYYSRGFYPVYNQRGFITSSYSGNLGYAYPTALGAKVAQPGKAVVALSGDGGFMYNSQEMATAVQHGINAVVVVFNDNAYGNVMRDQKTQFEGRVYGSQLRNPDFMKLADAYGARGVRVHKPEELEKALKEAIGVQAPSLIEVPVGEMPFPY